MFALHKSRSGLYNHQHHTQPGAETVDVHTIVWIKSALQVVFFLALAGCTTTVLLSWIKLLRDAFSKDDDEGPAPDETRTQRRPGTRSEL
jgi:hypothetical protein